MDHENLAFYDAVLEYAYKYEYWHAHLFKGNNSLSPDLNLLVIQRAGAAKNHVTDSSLLHSKNIRASVVEVSSSTKPSGAAEAGVVIKMNESNHSSNNNKSQSKRSKNDKSGISTSSASNAQLLKLHTVVLDAEKKKKNNAFGIQGWQIDNKEEFLKFNNEACSRLIAEFFAKDASQELNINGGTRSYTVKCVAANHDYSPVIFRKALEEVIVMISTNSFARFKKQAVLTNIGKGEQSMRLFQIALGLAIVIPLICYFHIINPGAPLINRLYYLIGFAWFYSGVIQYRYKFCYIHGIVGTRNFSRRWFDYFDSTVNVQMSDHCARVSARMLAAKMVVWVGALSGASVGILMAIPPYNLYITQPSA